MVDEAIAAGRTDPFSAGDDARKVEGVRRADRRQAAVVARAAHLAQTLHGAGKRELLRRRTVRRESRRAPRVGDKCASVRATERRSAHESGVGGTRSRSAATVSTPAAQSLVHGLPRRSRFAAKARGFRLSWPERARASRRQAEAPYWAENPPPSIGRQSSSVDPATPVYPALTTRVRADPRSRRMPRVLMRRARQSPNGWRPHRAASRPRDR